MFNSKHFSNYRKSIYTLLITVLMQSFLTSCMPTASGPSVNTSNSTENEDGSTSNPSTLYQEPNFPFDSIFVQESSVQTTGQFTLPLNFNDSFLIRGKSLSLYLRKLPSSTNICLVGKYSYLAGSDKFLVLSAKSKSYTDLINKTTEFYLQVEPANDQANQGDCLTYNLSTTLFNGASAPSLSFSLQQLCTNCSNAVTSTPLKLYFINGEEVPDLSLGAMTMVISGSATSSANTCVDSSACKARGFDCCLGSQCVKDGALRPSAITAPGFQAAEEDVRLNPGRFVVYPQFYYVCESRPDNTTGGSSDGSGPTDPAYEAAVRLRELTHLHECLNQVEGEFSYCTVKFSKASKAIPGEFSASSLGFTDDISFSTLNPNYTGTDYENNIVKITYANTTLYELNKPAGTGSNFVAASKNDNLSTAQSINVTAPLPSNAQDDNLYITYKVDGTCELIGSSMARCKKTYIQDSDADKKFLSTWHDASNIFYLPTYADLSPTSSVIVRISGVIVPEDSSTWTKVVTNELHNGVVQPLPRIEFNSTYKIYQNQTVEISYFVTSDVTKLLKMKTAAQNQVNTMCTCSSAVKCNLKPLYNTDSSLVNYECVYPTPTSTEPPVNQTVYVSNKNVPHRYYDLSGVNYDEDYGSAPEQELLPFSYSNNDVLKPNNASAFVGFNEIYGSFAKTGTRIARPAKLVKVKKDKQYDIIVSSGVFSSCTTCGTDYYTSLQKLFPQNFSGMAGGYTPDYYESRRENSSSVYRSDDLLFGRACFVPATMIPWTHVTANSPREQRRARLSGQHFLFANGYSRDWYGFDYGSLIGSFDGVSWFSIGNARRIKASTGKLYLAVNAYFGDLSIDSNFNVSISESNSYSSPIPEHDTATDGAQCQKAHYCSNDNDCYTQLGYDYSCQNISGITTSWPQFDAAGAEVVGSLTKTLASIVGGTNGQSKRCVYRGRGAPCLNDLYQANSATTFNGSSIVGNLSCSPNNSCAPTTSNRFNDRIARFASSPLAQNLAEVVTPAGDTVGLGAKVIGRPYDYYGKKPVPTAALNALNKNNVKAVCTPGRDIQYSVNNYDLNARAPFVNTESSDKLFGVGPTMATTVSNKYLNACPATDNAGFALQHYDLPLGSDVLNMFTITQNMSSNLLNLSPFVSQNIFSSLNGSQVKTVGYQRNTCLRAPGASCFSDMECAPSSFIATKAKLGNFTGIMSEAEEKFWEEELVCGNPDFKLLSPGVFNPNFSVKKNICCRDIGKTLSVYTQTDTSNFKWCDTTTKQVKVAGVNASISDSTRYSRVHTAYDKMTCDPTQLPSKSFALSIAANTPAERLSQILGQYKTLDTLNQRTCCTQNWVRSFHPENGGGHNFANTKMQTINKEMFKHISWFPQDTSITIDTAFHCGPTDYANSSCEVRTFSPSDEEKYLTWAGSLELLGIPQVAVETNNTIHKLVDDAQLDNAAAREPLNFSIKDVNDPTVGGSDFDDTAANKTYYSAASYEKFDMDSLKKVFSENEFNCCVPSGQEVPESVTSSQCCTGYVANNNNQRRCCLPDFTNLTVYLNRYVSSEGRGLPDNAYDSKTGYIKDPGQVQLMATQKNLCCSGKAMTGFAISKLSIPITGGTFLPEGELTTSRRFNYRIDEVDNNAETKFIGSKVDDGLRWNNHVYCVPDGYTAE